ncbi:MAG: prepilin peptidase [Desulfarculaceae bacterium]
MDFAFTTKFFFIITAAAAGLALGSFIHTLANGLAGGPSPLRIRSRCPTCAHPLAWHDLIPIFSYLWLRGRCKYCRQPISPSYPLSELTAAGLVLVWVLGLGLNLTSLLCLGVSLALMLVSLVDIKIGIVPNVVVYPSLAAVLILAPLFPAGSRASAGLGAGVIAAGLLLLAWLYQGLRGQPGLGMGDVKLGALLGAVLGWHSGIYAVFLGAILGVTFNLALLILGKISWDTKLPFAPFLSLGGLVMMLTGFGPANILFLNNL